MWAKLITVYGYSRKSPCALIRKTFCVTSEEQFCEFVSKWEVENDIFEWSR